MVPRRPPRRCCWTARRVEGTPWLLTGARSQVAGLAWSAMCCTVWHGSTAGAHLCTLIYFIIIGRCADLYSVRSGGGIWYVLEVLRLTVCPPAWRRLCIGGLRICCIVCAGIAQINGNATVKPCKRFWRFGCIIAWME